MPNVISPGFDTARADLGVPSMVLRLEPDHPAIATLPDNSRIFAVHDRSPSGQHVVSSAAGFKLRTGANGINTANAFSFDGSTFLAGGLNPSYLDPTIDPAVFKPGWVACVVSATNFTAARIIVAGDGTGLLLRTNITTGLPHLEAQASANIADATTALVAATPAVLVATYSATGAYAFYVNGTAAGSGTSNQTFSAGGKLHIGGSSGSGSFLGLMGDVLIGAGAVLTATERSMLTARLGSRYGITVA